MNGPTEDPYQQQCELCYGTGWLEKAKPQHNAEVSDRRAHSNENTTGANGGSLH